jgi:hypothetical protein
MADPLDHLAQDDLELHEQTQALRDAAEALRKTVLERCGADDSRTVRAGEICDSLQRLQWDLERRGQASAATNGHQS